mgnify:CR=1 FL=1
MAVVNQYKFAGLNANTDNTEKNPFGSGNPLVSETYLIKSILVSSAGTPSPTVTNNGIVVIKSEALTANKTVELLTQPLVMEEKEILKVQAGEANELHVIASILEIQPREVTT